MPIERRGLEISPVRPVVMSETKSKPLSSALPEASGLHLNQVVIPHPASPVDPQHVISTTDFIRKAVAEQPASDAARLVLPKDAGLISAETLLAIVSYCYAKGIYGCRDIELAILQDRELRSSFGNNLPSDACLRRFRRLNRTAIQNVLEKTFVQAKRELGRIPPDHEPEVGRGVNPTGSTATPGATGPDKGETTFLAREAAVDRLQKALFVDGMTRDA